MLFFRIRSTVRFSPSNFQTRENVPFINFDTFKIRRKERYHEIHFFESFSITKQNKLHGISWSKWERLFHYWLVVCHNHNEPASSTKSHRLWWCTVHFYHTTHTSDENNARFCLLTIGEIGRIRSTTVDITTYLNLPVRFVIFTPLIPFLRVHVM